MKKPAIVLRSALLALALCAAAPCPELPETREAAVTLEIAPTDTVRAAPPAEAFTDAGLDPARSEYAVLGGQMMGRFAVSVRTKTEGLAHPMRGGHCIWAAGAEAKITYTPKIFLNPTAPPCMDGPLRAHEAAHVAEDLALAAGWTQELEATLRRALAGSGMRGPMENDEIDAARGRMSAQIGAAVSAAFDDMMKTRAPRHAALDTHESYTRLRAGCGE